MQHGDGTWSAQLAELLDPSVNPRNRRLPAAEFEARRQANFARTTEKELREQARRATWIENQFIEMSLQLTPEEMPSQWQGSAVVNGTVVESWARPSKMRWKHGKPVEMLTSSVNPDAAWHARTRDERDDAETRRPRSDYTYGREAAFVVSGRDDPNVPCAMEGFILGAVLHQPGRRPGQHAVEVLQDIKERGYPAKWLAGDLLYSNCQPELTTSTEAPTEPTARHGHPRRLRPRSGRAPAQLELPRARHRAVGRLTTSLELGAHLVPLSRPTSTHVTGHPELHFDADALV